MNTPQSDPAKEGQRIADAAEEAKVDLRITGGVGVALRCPSASKTPLSREYADVDLVGRSKQRRSIDALLTGLGYQPDAAFNAVHGARRLFFWDQENNRQLDIFLDRLEMCHNIDLSERLTVDRTTVSLADLLLMKLQIVETNEKDLLDIAALFVDQPLTDDDSGINIRYLTALTSSDWGLWKTITMVAERTDHYTRGLKDFTESGRHHERVAQFLKILETSDKSLRWRLRARVGERVGWYELPEEVR